MTDLVDAYIRRREADHRPRGPGVEPVDRADVGRGHHLVVGEGERGERCADGVEEAGHALALGAHGVTAIEAPAAPLGDHATRQIADHAELRAGEVTQQRGREGHRCVPEEPDPPTQHGGVLPPVTTASRHGDDLLDARGGPTGFVDERHDLPAQAVPQPGEGDIARPPRQRVHRGGRVERRPGLDGRIDLAQRAAAREPHPAEVEAQHVEALRDEEPREGLVEALRNTHGGRDEHGPADGVTLFDPEEASGEAIPVGGRDHQVVLLVVLRSRRTLFAFAAAALRPKRARLLGGQPGRPRGRAHPRGRRRGDGSGRGGGRGEGHGDLLRGEATTTSQTYCCDRDR